MVRLLRLTRRGWMGTGSHGSRRLDLGRSGRLCGCSVGATGTLEFRRGSMRLGGRSLLDKVRTEAELEDALSRPGERDVAFLREFDGDILILGAGGKMGPSLARLCRRAADAAGTPRRVIAV